MPGRSDRLGQNYFFNFSIKFEYGEGTRRFAAGEGTVMRTAAETLRPASGRRLRDGAHKAKLATGASGVSGRSL